MGTSTSPALAPTSDVDSRRDGSGTFLQPSRTRTPLPVRRSHKTSSMICTVLEYLCSAVTVLIPKVQHRFDTGTGTYITITESSQSVSQNRYIFYKYRY